MIPVQAVKLLLHNAIVTDKQSFFYVPQAKFTEARVYALIDCDRGLRMFSSFLGAVVRTSFGAPTAGCIFDQFYSLTHELATMATQICNVHVCVGDVLPKGVPSHAQLSPLYPQHHSHDKIP